MKRINKFKLQSEKQKLEAEYSNLETEKKNAETIIICQVRKGAIEKRQDEIIKQIYQIDGKLLKENEEFKMKREEENKGHEFKIISKSKKK